MRHKIGFIVLGGSALLLASCGDPAKPAPSQLAPVTQQTQPVKTPVAATPDGSEANTGNRVNGIQAPTGSPH